MSYQMADPSDAEDFKLWPTPIEKHFIDVFVEEEAKGAFQAIQEKPLDSYPR